MIAKPMSKNHKNTRKISNNDILGGSLVISPSSGGFTVLMFESGAGMIVDCIVFVGIGKSKVIAGNGKSVVVGVTVGVEAGVYVREGVIAVAVDDCVFVPVAAASFTRCITSA